MHLSAIQPWAVSCRGRQAETRRTPTRWSPVHFTYYCLILQMWPTQYQTSFSHVKRLLLNAYCSLLLHLRHAGRIFGSYLAAAVSQRLLFPLFCESVTSCSATNDQKCPLYSDLWRCRLLHNQLVRALWIKLRSFLHHDNPKNIESEPASNQITGIMLINQLQLIKPASNSCHFSCQNQHLPAQWEASTRFFQSDKKKTSDLIVFSQLLWTLNAGVRSSFISNQFLDFKYEAALKVGCFGASCGASAQTRWHTTSPSNSSHAQTY